MTGWRWAAVSLVIGLVTLACVALVHTRTAARKLIPPVQVIPISIGLEQSGHPGANFQLVSNAAVVPADPGPAPAAQPQPAAAVGANLPTTNPADPAVAQALTAGRGLIAAGQLVRARELLNGALLACPDDGRSEPLRAELTSLNQTLIFSPLIDPADPLVSGYLVSAGDKLVKLAPRWHVPWQFLARINSAVSPNALRPGQKIKVIRGPFLALVSKSRYRLDVFLHGPSGPMFICSFPVGLGADGSTPLGQFVVARQSKLTNPPWTNPRTGQRVGADDPSNPLGEYWIGLRGIEPVTKDLKGYGIHGTIEPQTIGQEASMGCVRLLAEDIHMVYDMLSEDESSVQIVR